MMSAINTDSEDRWFCADNGSGHYYGGEFSNETTHQTMIVKIRTVYYVWRVTSIHCSVASSLFKTDGQFL